MRPRVPRGAFGWLWRGPSRFLLLLARGFANSAINSEGPDRAMAYLSRDSCRLKASQPQPRSG